MKKIKDYFKNTDKTRLYEDFYAITFIIAGIASMIYIGTKIARCRT